MGNESPSLTPDGKQPAPPAGRCVKRTGPGPESPRRGLTASLWPCDLGQANSYFWLSQSCLQSETPPPCQLGGRPASPARVCVEAPAHTRGALAWRYFHCALHTSDFPHCCCLSTPVSLALLPFHASAFQIRPTTQMEGVSLFCSSEYHSSQHMLFSSCTEEINYSRINDPWCRNIVTAENVDRAENHGITAGKAQGWVTVSPRAYQVGLHGTSPQEAETDLMNYATLGSCLVPSVCSISSYLPPHNLPLFGDPGMGRPEHQAWS